MKKGCFFVFLFFLGLPFITYAQNRSIFIEGSSAIAAHQTFFMDNFRMEGTSSGYNIVNARGEAGYIFRFAVSPNFITYDDGTRVPAPPDEPQFVISITLLNNEDSSEVVSFGFLYRDLDEMNEYTQFLFLRAAVNIPNEEVADVVIVSREEEDDSWRNKWLYLRAALNYRITILTLNDNNLIDGTGVYTGTYTNPTAISPMDNRTNALPGMTFGVEVQFLNWMSVEPNLQLTFGETNQFLTAAAGIELKFPIKRINNVVLAPNTAFTFPLSVSPIFDKFPPITWGFGIQVGVRGGNSGALFFDFSCMFSLSNAAIYNPIADLYPNPAIIHYQRSVIGFGIGYKYGFINRK